MLGTPPSLGRPRRPSLRINSSAATGTDIYSDARSHGYQGPTRSVRLPRATSGSGGAIAKSEDGWRCVVAGKDSLRIMRMSDSPSSMSPDHKSAVGRGGHRIDGSRNLWNSSILKVDSVSTDVAWGCGNFHNKVLTSARNGELIMWDLNKMGPSKYERRVRLHTRAIHKLAYSELAPYYCLTGAADGDVRVWDLRDLTKSVIRLHHPNAVRAAAFSPSSTNPVHAVVGLDNGSIYRWDLKMGLRGQLDRVPVAHAGPILALDWFKASFEGSPGHHGSSSEGSSVGSSSSGSGSNGGWIASGGLDRTVKVWDITSSTHISHTPTYTLSTSFPVRRVLSRPGYECELAIVSNAEFGTGSNPDLSGAAGEKSEETLVQAANGDEPAPVSTPPSRVSDIGDAVEIWDVRRSYIAKWVVAGSAVEGGVTDIAFRDSHALWAQHVSGTFAQLDLRHSYRPLDSIPRVAATWDAAGTLAFVTEQKTRWEIPYDDVDPAKRPHVLETSRLKAIGDMSFKPTQQSFGTHEYAYSREEMDMFTRLAKGCIFEGADKHTICGVNAEVAIQANHISASQTWLLMQSLFAPEPETRPPTPPLSPLPFHSPVFPHSHSAPAAIPRTVDFPSATNSLLEPVRSFASEPLMQHSPPSRSSPGNSPARPLTPSSSNSPSPQRLSTGPPSAVSPSSSTPSMSARPPSAIFARRPSNASFLAAPQRTLALQLRRPSMSSPSSAMSVSDGSSLSTPPRLRHVGESALSDSDSDGGDASDEDPRDNMSSAAVSPTSAIFHRGILNTTHPSPLSRQTWSEEEGDEKDDDENEGTPSPRSSTDSESSGSPPTRSARLPASARSQSKSKSKSQSRTRTRKNSVIRAKARSNSSPLAVPPAPPSLAKQGSRSSMRTVTAGDVSLAEHDTEVGVASAKDDAAGSAARAGESSPRGARITSLGVSEGAYSAQSKRRSESVQDRMLRDEVARKEDRMRELGWVALKGALEVYVQEGDLQMCTLMALVAQDELHINERRMVRFVDGYIELLTRLRLHTSAAYLRKHTQVEEIQAPTKLQTTVYISCGRCEKPIVVQQGSSFCTTCRNFSAVCSICHLPVRSMLFHCAVCSHGGHQDCYRRYYMERPMVEIARPPTPPPTATTHRGRSVSRSSTVTTVEDGEPWEGRTDPVTLSNSLPLARPLMGHPCAAGCGHFCWVANEKEDDV
ncbi:WD40 repeat-like protein [Auriscalpium vulgare]|uniref:WD40 repeat-like protein n=1 Tax=Auriscalpium vulgare TaxID=40419 RepID=A0ACB8RJ26_9AGAM|nr:WD40 repeat-like protein [Auriscalpium vulgare]